MRWTCTRHVGRAPMGPPNSPAATYLCANRALSGMGGAPPGEVRQGKRNRIQTDGPANATDPMARESDLPPAQHRRRPMSKADAGGEMTCIPQASESKATSVGSQFLINSGPINGNDNEEGKGLVRDSKIQVVRQCPVSPMADRPQSRCECPAQCSPTRLGKCRTT